MRIQFYFYFLFFFETGRARKAADDCEMLNHLFSPLLPYVFQVLADTKKERYSNNNLADTRKLPQPDTNHHLSLERKEKRINGND